MPSRLLVWAVLAGCGARTGAWEKLDVDASPVPSDVFVPASDAGQCCRDGIDVQMHRATVPGGACGVDLHIAVLVENCGGQPVDVPVLVQLFAGDRETQEGRVLREAWTAPGMPGDMGQWLEFDVPYEEWLAVMHEMGNEIYVFADPLDDLEECQIPVNSLA